MKDLAKKIKEFDDKAVYTEAEMWNAIDFIRTTMNGSRTPMIALGEFGELIAVVSDYEARPDKKEEGSVSLINIIDEMADAKLLLLSLQQHYNIPDDILNKAMTLKLFAGKQKAYKYKEEVKKANDKLHHDLLHLADEDGEKYGK